MGENKRAAKFYDRNENLRKAIKEQFGSNAAFAEALSENGLQISAEGVRQWAGGYTKPREESYAIIADVLGCSVDFLMGRSNFVDEQKAHYTVEELGLSEKAACMLDAVNFKKGGRGFSAEDQAKGQRQIELLSHLLEKPDFWSFLDYLSDYISSNAAGVQRGNAIVETDTARIQLSGAVLSDLIWSEAVKPLRNIVDEISTGAEHEDGDE